MSEFTEFLARGGLFLIFVLIGIAYTVRDAKRLKRDAARLRATLAGSQLNGGTDGG